MKFMSKLRGFIPFILMLISFVLIISLININSLRVLIDLPSLMVLFLTVVVYIVLIGRYRFFVLGLKLLLANKVYEDDDLIVIKNYFSGLCQYILLIGVIMTLGKIIYLHNFFDDRYLAYTFFLSFTPIFKTLLLVFLFFYPIILKANFLMQTKHIQIKKENANNL
ncbi:hypothetical protein EDC19_0688 [Natranaerovirga hydrolytica]|uniref:Uncharacterized protein n=1 Tax=Natranaerovirga hydrolytica TaxID=680378 RepID=A0A4R1MYA6_9FIRM|nr:hypothetical protein [Natranaerovirga hydrolytica]TCK98268.1 hypothetical protein EDC19_0688 [Natranaerovirga hydrolytica]